MTQKKKAELQRKLSMAPVTRPPGDLLARLKNDIPGDLLSTQRERERVSRSLSFSLRVAAAIVIMITSTFAMVQFLSRSKGGDSPQQSVQPQAMAEVTVTMADAARPNDEFKAVDQVKVETTAAPQRRAFAKERRDEDRGMGGVVGGVVGGTITEVAANAPPPAAPPIPAPVPVPAPEPAEAVDQRADFAQPAMAPAPVSSRPLMREAQAANLSFTPAQTIFGISVDSNEFGRLKTLIEKGQTPEAAEVNINALVNHFAGTSPPRRDVRLQVEGSRAPLAGNSMVLRYTIDTAESTMRGSLPPAATNARLEIELNPKVVEDYTLGDGASLQATERVLLMNLSATGLIEIRLRPDARPRDQVATVRLRYHSVRDGKEHPLMRTVYVRELRRGWIEASRRHRLATLGAVWGESLKGKATAVDVARRAEELATEAPSDDRARDLANAASASSRLQTSGPTGSER